jgi:hypothetical protein
MVKVGLLLRDPIWPEAAQQAFNRFGHQVTSGFMIRATLSDRQTMHRTPAGTSVDDDGLMMWLADPSIRHSQPKAVQ